MISIHALLAESDGKREPDDDAGAYFYPRSPCGERLWNAPEMPTQEDFYPRSPCGERRWLAPAEMGPSDFYPRSPCGERQLAAGDGLADFVFLSTLSLRRATFADVVPVLHGSISIHALLAESDDSVFERVDKILYFYPRSPCGERPRSAGPWQAECRDFYPRSPCGERQKVPQILGLASGISIHALLAESDASFINNQNAIR